MNKINLLSTRRGSLMRNRLIMTFVILCLVSSFPLQARRQIVTFDLTPLVGYRQDNVRWRTKSGTVSPGVTLPVGKFRWRNINGIEYGFNTRTTIRDRYIMDVDFEFANFLGGTMKDTDYLAAPGSGNPIQNSMKLNNGFAFSPNLAFGIKLKPSRAFDLTPLIGIDYNRLRLTGKKNAGSPLTSLTNTLQSYGPYLGFDSKTKFTKRISMNFGAAISLAYYNGRGNWRFQQNTSNNTMRQTGSGFGLRGQIGLKYMLFQSITVGGEADINWNRILRGNDTRRFSNDGGGKVHLNNVNWTSFSGRLTLTKSF